MGNCLVTKLKGTVANDNLMKIGEFVFSIKAKENVRCVITFSGPAECAKASVRVIQGDAVLSYKEGGSSWNLSSITQDSIVGITNKYSIVSVIGDGVSGIDVSDFQYAPLTIIDLYSSGYEENKGDIDCLAGKEITTFNIEASSNLVGNISSLLSSYSAITKITISGSNGNGVTCDLSDLENCINLTSLRFGTYASNISGDIASLSKLTKLTGDITLGRNTAVYGNIEDLVEGQVKDITNPRRSGSFRVVQATSSIKLNGVACISSAISFGENTVTVSTTNGTLLATYNIGNDSWTYIS